MWLVNFTALSTLRGLPEIHSRFDRNSVNDSVAVANLRRAVEGEGVFKVVDDKELLAGGIVRPCSEGVWKAALQTLRDENPGVYFYPIFPPK